MSEEKFEYSMRVQERLEKQRFRISKDELSLRLSTFGEFDFAYVFEVANSNGEINFIGKVAADSPRKLIEVFYETNVSSLALAYLDGLVELMRNRDWPHLNKNLTVREVESFLRDDNSHSAFPPKEVQHFRIHDCLNGLFDYP